MGSWLAPFNQTFFEHEQANTHLMFVNNSSKGQISNEIEWNHLIPLCIGDSFELSPQKWVIQARVQDIQA